MYLRKVSRYAGLIGLAASIVCGTISRSSAESTLLIDAESGKVLQSENATYPWYPASTTKLMTAYVILMAVKQGRITLDSPFTVSAFALSQPPTKMGFKVGTTVTVDNAMKMLMVKSANDMAVVLAEGLDGTMEKFADEMNATATRLGMTQTHFVNPNGLPADGHVSSARDMGILARAIFKDIPEYDYYWHLPGIKFGRRVVMNYNKLIALYPGADGMKTGFICASGFNLVASATRDNRRLIAVVFGAPSSATRAYKAAKMLEQGFKGDKLSWLMPSLGTVDQLKPIEGVAPPDLREEMCGPKRKRPAAEDEEVDMSQTGEDGQTSPLAFMLSSLHGTVKASQVLAGAIASLPPVEVFVGAFKPRTTQAAEAQEKELAGGGPKKKAKGKAKTAAAKPDAASDKTTEAKTDAAKPDTAKADAKSDTAKGEAAKPPAKPVKHAAAKVDAKPADPKPAEAKPAAKPAAKPKTAATSTATPATAPAAAPKQ